MAVGFLRIADGATFDFESGWVLNTSEPFPEGSTVLCGTKAGAQIKKWLKHK